MKKTLLALGAALLLAGNAAEAQRLTPESFAGYVSSVNQRALNPDKGWLKSNHQAASPLKVVTQADAMADPCSYWGSMYTPDGLEWMYLMDYETEIVGEYMTTIKAVHISIYDENFKLYRTLDADFELTGNETSINSVQVSPYLTRKFFNINDDYEVILFVHAITDDFQGHEYNKIYTLKDGSYVGSIEGNNIAAVNTATDSWSENYTMVFMREEFNEEVNEETGAVDYQYFIHFDVYSRAGYSTPFKLEHTFTVDYNLFAGAGNYALPIMIKQHGGNIYYALPHYEKPYFVEAYAEDITPDNNFIIELYDKNFQLVKETKIPMTLTEGAIFSFPGVGELAGNDDMTFGVYNNSDLPCYVVGVEDYVISYDDFSTSFYVYDADGNLLKTIIKNAVDYVSLSDVPGHEDQWCFFQQVVEDGVVLDEWFQMVDMPSGNMAAKLPIGLSEGLSISFSIDRVAHGDSYRYVSSLAMADVDEDDNALHMIVWFEDNGAYADMDVINLGQNITMAQPNISAYVLDPYLFNTDSEIEYMFLVKQLVNPESSFSREYLRIYGADSNLLLEMGPDEENDQALNSIYVVNKGTNHPKLVVSYYGNDQYTIRVVDLPLEKFAGGDGTSESPYLIAQPGDLMAVYTAPKACYKIVNDLDFESTPWTGNSCDFTGKLDGGNHTVSNLSLIDNGIFSQISGKAEIKDIAFKDVKVVMDGIDAVGVIAGTAIGGSATPLRVQNISIENLEVTGSSSAQFGSIIGFQAVGAVVEGASVKGASVYLPHAVAGGIAGRVLTGAKVNASYFDGVINAAVTGGIAGESYTGDEEITNCHVNADVRATGVAGGIIGYSHRSKVVNCYTEGSVYAYGTNEVYAGGIAGSIEPIYEPPTYNVVENCLTASVVTANPSAKKPVAHRIAGYTSIDEVLYDWDNMGPNVDYSDPSTFPTLPSNPEKALMGNFAIDVAVIDNTVADADTSTEGASIAKGSLTDDFLAQYGWLKGESYAQPWYCDGIKLLLFFEPHSTTGMDSVATASKLSFNGSEITGNGLIAVYTASGLKVLEGYDSLAVDALATGIYVATSAEGNIKFIKR